MSEPTRIRSIAVHREDVATALEASIRTDREVVLRITPPFSGRMRARLHEAIGGSGIESGGDEVDESGTHDGSTDDESTDDGTIHVDPRRLVADVPPYPEVDETTAAFPDADIETRRERHAAAVAEWRATVRGSVVDSVTIEANGGEHAVDVAVLG
ncbi:hypothetical protein [Halorubrum sp. DTA98]|uniref:hypothetical protein n=1 Tax=Halorubrum sp. DTA98 TaxID=3402163 RepID=UPI003AAC01F6